MPDLRAILRRFRPAAAPGMATERVGVPADRPAEREAELALVVALLEDVERECDALVAAARVAAEERRRQAALDADGVRAAGRARAPIERAAAGASVRQDADRDAAMILAGFAEAAGRASELGQRRLPGLVDAARARIRVRLAALPELEPACDTPVVSRAAP